MLGRLPERVRSKTYKAEFSELFENVISAPQGKARLNNPAILRHTDWLDPERFVPRMKSMAGSGRFWPLWVFLGVDLWLENVLACTGQSEETSLLACQKNQV